MNELLQIFCAICPRSVKNLIQILYFRRNSTEPAFLPVVLKYFFLQVTRCWAQDPHSRPNFTELRLHLADLLDGSCVDLDTFALDNRFQLQTRTKNRRSRNTGKGTVTLVGNGSFTVNSRILDNQFSIV